MTVSQRQTSRFLGSGRRLGVLCLASGVFAALACVSGGCSYSCVDEYRSIRTIEIAPTGGDGSSLVSMIPAPVDRHQTAMTDATGPTRTDSVDRVSDRQ